MILVIKKIGQLIHKARKSRRETDWLINLARAYKENKSKLMLSPKTNRIMFRSIIEKTLKGLDTTYNYRILNEDDVSKIINSKKTPRTKFDIDLIQKWLFDGKTMTQIAKELGTSQPQISWLCKKFNLKKGK